MGYSFKAMIDKFLIHNNNNSLIKIEFDQDFELFCSPFTMGGNQNVDIVGYAHSGNKLYIKLNETIESFELILPYYKAEDRISLKGDITISKKKKLSEPKIDPPVFITIARDIYTNKTNISSTYYLFFAEYEYRTQQYVNIDENYFGTLMKRMFYRGVFGKQSLPYMDYKDYSAIKIQIDELYELQIGIIRNYFHEDFSKISEAFYLFSSGLLRRGDEIPSYYFQPDSWHIFLWAEFFILAYENKKLSDDDLLYCVKLALILVIMQEIYLEIYGKDRSRNIAAYDDFKDVRVIYPHPNRNDTLIKIKANILKKYSKISKNLFSSNASELDTTFGLLGLSHYIKKLMGELVFKAFSNEY